MKPYNDERSKGEQVEAMFDGIAPVYDRLNDILSLGIARSWRRKLVRGVHVCEGKILDLATGTGDLAGALKRRFPQVRITGADPSEGMLAVARAKVRDVDFVRARAEDLPFGDGEFDVVTAAFGVRNFSDIPRALGEMHRVLKGGGETFILEFSTPHNKVFGAVYGLYFRRILPAIGALLSRDKRAYDYLPKSVGEFAAPQEFADTMRSAGFADITARPLFGGVAYIYKGRK